MPEGDQPIKDSYLRRCNTPAWQGVELIRRSDQPVPSGQLTVLVPLRESTLALLSTPRVTTRALLAAARPNGLRVGFALLGYMVFVYALTWGLSRFVTQPLLELQEGVTALSAGRRDVSVNLPKEAELATLASAFNAMAARLKEREEELAAASGRLEKALADKERIFATTSHELRTPLTAILGYAQMLQDGLKGPLGEEQSASLAVIERNANVLLSQVEDLLTLSRLQADQLPLREETVDLKDLVDDVLSSVRPLFDEAGTELEATWSREGPYAARLDYQRARQILCNLLDNARKYAPGGRVTVSLEEDERGTRVEVRDSGPGIPSGLEESLFHEFERGPNSEGVDGAGLGLALARGLARRFGGELELASSSPGAALRWTIPPAGGEPG